jgi:hypothetical protein
LPHERAGLGAAGFGEAAQLLDALIGQPQPVDRRPRRTPTARRQVSIAGGLGMAGLGGELVPEFAVRAGHDSSLSSAAYAARIWRFAGHAVTTCHHPAGG